MDNGMIIYGANQTNLLEAYDIGEQIGEYDSSLL
jgi:hypothetical protein